MKWPHASSGHFGSGTLAWRRLTIVCSPRARDKGPPGPRCWMAGLAWRLAGGGISFYYAILCIEYVQNMYRIYIYIYIIYMVYGIWYTVYGIRYTVYGYTGIRVYGYTGIRDTVYGYTGYGNLPRFSKNKSSQNCPS